MLDALWTQRIADSASGAHALGDVCLNDTDVEETVEVHAERAPDHAGSFGDLAAERRPVFRQEPDNLVPRPAPGELHGGFHVVIPVRITGLIEARHSTILARDDDLPPIK